MSKRPPDEEASSMRSTFEIADVYQRMRHQVLALAHERPAAIEAHAGDGVLAVLMDTSRPDYAFSVAAIADGTLSLYLSNGGGALGTGQWSKVAGMVQLYVRGASDFAGHCRRTEASPLPRADHVAFYIVTTSGVLAAEIAESELEDNHHPLSPLFVRSHHLLATIRHVSEMHENEQPLVFAAELGEAGIVGEELQKGVSADTRSTDGTPVLLVAARNGETTIVERLLNAGAAIDAQDAQGLTSLHMAAHLGHDDTARVLIERGGTIDLGDRTGYTPLMMAANAGQLACVRTLLDHGASPDAEDKDGSTPLMFAAQHGHAEIVSLLGSVR